MVCVGDVSCTFKKTYSLSPASRLQSTTVRSAALVTSHKCYSSFLRVSFWSVLDGVLFWMFLLQVYLCRFPLVSSMISTLWKSLLCYQVHIYWNCDAFLVNYSLSITNGPLWMPSRALGSSQRAQLLDLLSTYIFSCDILHGLSFWPSYVSLF